MPVDADLRNWHRFESRRLSESIIYNDISGVMVSVLASSAVARWFEHLSGQTKDYKIGICCFSAKRTALRSKSKDWLTQNQDNVSEWGDITVVSMSWPWKNPTKRVSLVQKQTSSSSYWKLTCSRHVIAEQISIKQQSLTDLFTYIVYWIIFLMAPHLQE
jgi:hypothetical protein